MTTHEQYMASEYYRRSVQAARCATAADAVKQARKRVWQLKRHPQWLLKYLGDADERLVGISKDLADWRDAAPDRSLFVGESE